MRPTPPGMGGFGFRPPKPRPRTDIGELQQVSPLAASLMARVLPEDRLRRPDEESARDIQERFAEWLEDYIAAGPDADQETLMALYRRCPKPKSTQALELLARLRVLSAPPQQRRSP